MVIGEAEVREARSGSTKRRELAEQAWSGARRRRRPRSWDGTSEGRTGTRSAQARSAGRDGTGVRPSEAERARPASRWRDPRAHARTESRTRRRAWRCRRRGSTASTGRERCRRSEKRSGSRAVAKANAKESRSRTPFKCKMVICTDAVCAQAEIRCADRVTIWAEAGPPGGRRSQNGDLAEAGTREASIAAAHLADAQTEIARSRSRS